METTKAEANLVVNCSKCDRVILVAVMRPGGIYSEYRDKAGRCFKCARSKRAN